MIDKQQILTFNPKRKLNVESLGVDEIDAKTLYPLNTSWCFWCQVQSHKGTTQEKYGNQTKLMFTVENVQQFWNYWASLPQPSTLLEGNKMMEDKSTLDALMIFRHGCRPEWEDPLNAGGGHFQYIFKPLDTDLNIYNVDEYWNNIVLAVVGEAHPWVKYITGLRLVDKISHQITKNSNLRIEIWFSNELKDPQTSEVQKLVEECMSRKLEDDENGPSTGKAPVGELKKH